MIHITVMIQLRDIFLSFLSLSFSCVALVNYTTDIPYISEHKKLQLSLLYAVEQAISTFKIYKN